MRQVGEVAECGRDQATQLVVVEPQLRQVREAAECGRDRATQPVSGEGQRGDATAVVGVDAIPVADRLVAQPVVSVPPIRAVRGIVERNQYVPIRVRR